MSRKFATSVAWAPAAALAALIGLAPIAAPAAEPPRARDDMRMPWQRSNDRFVRSWLTVGAFAPAVGQDALATDFLSASGGEAQARPTEGATVQRPDGSAAQWRSQKAWDDTIDLSGLAGGPASPGVAGYAFATLTRAQAGPARLAVGSDEGVRVWVNGRLALEHRGRRALMPDDDLVDVELAAGANTVLVKTEQTSGPWAFHLRVLETGTELARRDEISPSIVADGPTGSLVVLTHPRPALPGQANVVVALIAPGGRVVTTRTVARGARVALPAAWLAGPYEVRCTTRRVDGSTFVAHLPYYAGDALAAARRLVEAAGQADAARPAGFTLKMLADMVLDRLGGKLEGDAQAWRLIHSPLMEWEELKLEAAGQTGAVRPYGFVRLAYRDDTDGSPQYCRAYLPSAYSQTKKWPLVVSLHGYNPANPVYVRWWNADTRHNVYPEDFDIVYIEPHGRGNTSYRGMGENDVLRVIALARERFNIDPDRIYLTGDSMGGWGTWQVGTRHPELFAAIAPIFGGGDYRLDRTDDAIAKQTPSERFLAERDSSFAQAEALLTTPVFIVHGDTDAAVKVDYSRYASRLLQRWGYDVRYWELPGYGHEDIGARGPIIEWFLKHKRQVTPRRVRVRAADLKSAAAHWLRIEQRRDPLAFMVAEAEVIDSNVVRLDTQNVAGLTLTPPPALVDVKRPLRVVWNGQAREVTFVGGQARLWAADVTPGAGLAKRPGLAGSLEDLHATPFAVVVGTTSPDPAMRALCAIKGQGFVTGWDQWQHQPLRLFKDTELSDADAARYSLVLIGGPEANAVTRRLAERLPLSVAPDRIVLDGRTFAVSDATIEMVYPSPLNPDRYVSVVAATSASGLYFWDSLLMNGDGGAWDFLICDGQTASGHGETATERRRVASGLFGADWRLATGVVIEGDAALRAENPLLRAPRLGERVEPGLAKSLVGRYQIRPGLEAAVTLEDDRLVLVVASQPKTELLPVEGDQLALLEANVNVTPTRDASGKITGVWLRQGGRAFPARKVE